jgi:hypothetical protein
MLVKALDNLTARLPLVVALVLAMITTIALELKELTAWTTGSALIAGLMLTANQEMHGTEITMDRLFATPTRGYVSKPAIPTTTAEHLPLTA